VIPKYFELRQLLQDEFHTLNLAKVLYPMLATMLEKTKAYLDKALSCDMLVMAKMLNPTSQIQFFHSSFG
ncbi:hypothetical protein DFH28DRAFT_867685, partial [Melampsora americana]